MAYSALGWLIEGATLWLLGAAVGLDLSAGAALVAGLVASLLSAEPLTPGGLGVTEPGIVLVLTSLGVGVAGASAIALLNRLVNYASLAVAGGALYLLSARPRGKPAASCWRSAFVDGCTKIGRRSPPAITHVRPRRWRLTVWRDGSAQREPRRGCSGGPARPYAPAH